MVTREYLDALRHRTGKNIFDTVFDNPHCDVYMQIEYISGQYYWKCPSHPLWREKVDFSALNWVGAEDEIVVDLEDSSEQVIGNVSQSSESLPRQEDKETDMSTNETSGLSGFFSGTLDRVKSGAKIGAAGEATLLCVETAESILGRTLPMPEFLGDNPALAEIAREFIGLSVVKLAAGFVGGNKAGTALAIAQLAETDIGVRAMHMFGPVVRVKMAEFVERAEAIVGDGEKLAPAPLDD